MSSKEFTRQIIEWPRQVNHDKHLRKIDLSVAVELSRYFNEKDNGGRAWPSCKTLGKSIGLHEVTVLRSVERLKRFGHLHVVPGRQGSGHTNQYWMILKPASVQVSKPEKPAGAQVSKPVAEQVSKPVAEQVSQNKKPATQSKKPATQSKKPAGGQENHLNNHYKNHHREEYISHAPDDASLGKNEEPAAAPRPTSDSELAPGQEEAAEGREARGTKLHRDAELAEGFQEFYRAYPRKKSPKKAREAFAKAVKEGTSVATLIAGAKRYAVERRDAVERDPTQAPFTKNPATWLNQGCWEDEPDGAPVIDQDGNVVAIERPPPQRPHGQETAAEWTERLKREWCGGEEGEDEAREASHGHLH